MLASRCGGVGFWVSDALRSLVCPSSCVVWVQSLWGMLCTHSLSAPERAVMCCAASHASAESAKVAGRPKWAQRQPGLSQLCIRQHITLLYAVLRTIFLFLLSRSLFDCALGFVWYPSLFQARCAARQGPSSVVMHKHSLLVQAVHHGAPLSWPCSEPVSGSV